MAMTWARIQVALLGAIALLAFTSTSEASTKISPTCKPLQKKTIPLGENPHFWLERSDAARIEVLSNKGKVLPVTVAKVDRRYVEVTVHATKGTRFKLYQGDCALKNISYLVRGTSSQKLRKPKVLEIDFESGNVLLSKTTVGWFEVEIADSAEDLAAGRAFRYFDYVDGTRELGLFSPFGKKPKAPIRSLERTRLSNGVFHRTTHDSYSSLFLSRHSLYVVRVTPRGFDGTKGEHFVGWVGRNARWGAGDAPKGKRESCQQKSLVAQGRSIVPTTATHVFDPNAHAYGDRLSYPYARTSDGAWLPVAMQKGIHPRAVRQGKETLYSVSAKDGTKYELGFLPFEEAQCRAQRAFGAEQVFPFSANATKAWSARDVLVKDGWINEYPGYEAIFIGFDIPNPFGAPLGVEWSVDGKVFHNVEGPGIVGAFKLPIYDAKKREYTVFLRVTPRWLAGDAASWQGWVHLSERPKTATGRSKTSFAWGTGHVAGRSLKGRGEH